MIDDYAPQTYSVSLRTNDLDEEALHFARIIRETVEDAAYPSQALAGIQMVVRHIIDAERLSCRPPGFTLHDVTGAMGEALRRRPPEWHLAHEREIRLFVDDTIAILRASAAHAGREYEASSASLTADPLG